MAKQTGISKSMLGQIERGVSIPTVETLGKIVSGLRVSFNSLISSYKEDIIQVKKNELAPYINDAAGYKAYEYFPYEEDRTFEIYMMELEPGSSYVSERHGDNTYEFLTVFSGILLLKLNDIQYEIGEENSIRFPTDVKHEYINPGDKTAKFSVTFTWD